MSSTDFQQLQQLLSFDRLANASVFSQVANGVADLIKNGTLRPGDKLPSIRKMAAFLSLHPKTIVAAFNELEAQGWIETKPRQGMYVSDELPIIKPVALKAAKTMVIHKPPKPRIQPMLIVDDGFPDHRLAPIDILLREYRSLMKKNFAIKASTEGMSSGETDLRIALSSWLRETRALPIDADHIFITRGAQMALYLICRSMVKKGMTIIVGEPNYPFANDVLQECGAKLIKVQMEADGIDVEAIKEHCIRKKIDGIYIIPHHHHPTTVTLSAEKRIALLELVERYQLLVIEDDYDYEFHYDSTPILPLASYAKGRHIFYIGSLSKVLSNSLRVGFICASPSSLPEIARYRRLVDLRGDTFFELALAEFIKSGELAKHVKRTCKVYKDRRDLLFQYVQDELADHVHTIKPKGGMALWTSFRESADLKNVSQKALKMGLAISDGTFYNTSGHSLNSIRFGFASKTPDEMEQIIDILKKVIR